jgi:hypothetical protein
LIQIDRLRLSPRRGARSWLIHDIGPSQATERNLISLPRKLSLIVKVIRSITPVGWRPIGYLTELTRQRTRLVVASGPFKGMRYVKTATCGAYIPRLLGIYERELASIVEEICIMKPSVVVVVGAGEGYYAVGFALRLPRTPVIAFEVNSAGRRLLAEMATLNGVAQRLSIRGKCEAIDLIEIASRHASPVYLLDVEGYEKSLLDLPIVPALSHTSILVELHEFVHPDITQRLISYFKQSHTVDLIWQEQRSRSEFPWRTLYSSFLPKSYIDWAVSEHRPLMMSWLWIKPKSSPETRQIHEHVFRN